MYPARPILTRLFLIAPESNNRSRSEINRDIDADYYGYRDEEDAILLEYEKALEKELIAKLFDAPDEEQTSAEERGHMEVDANTGERLAGSNDDATAEAGSVPTQKEVEAYLVQRRKQQLLDKYVSEDLKQNEEETKELTGQV